MRAFVLCAGRGERLRPYTDYLPKPLLPVQGKPLLSIILENLIAQGFHIIGLNAWHLKEKILAFAEAFRRNHPGTHLRIFVEPELLGTCGAMRYASSFFTEPTLVINGDILTNFPFRVVYEAFFRQRQPCLMFCHRRAGLNRVRVREGRVVGFGEDSPEGYAYTGIQVVSPEWVRGLPPERELVPAYERLIARGLFPGAFVAAGFYWQDIGTPETYRQALEDLRSGVMVPFAPGP
ncbi:sugar phosphate nucleotidyltransferase [Thermosulfurimonas sp. F29]|uniref:nucleotidyltransferase family protein n=1 Tax=Thermosulfurimonas sp. F29 TaxID=2867247 RepID=UPI001C828878|nr:sugar phosphate nucleotidyltransferase [Thermosulfurimonas sp. F29]MBX6423580.1 NTP transferase domain-containing protein [Thermosulfurimonas sp. F29]